MLSPARRKNLMQRLVTIHVQQRTIEDCVYGRILSLVHGKVYGAVPPLPDVDAQRFGRTGTRFGGICDLVTAQARIEMERYAL